MSAFDGAFERLMPERALDAEERGDVEAILDAAAEWDAGRLPHQEVATLGFIAYDGRPSQGYSRFVALVRADPADARRAALTRYFDWTLNQSWSDVVLTAAGIFTKTELGALGVPVRSRA